MKVSDSSTPVFSPNIFTGLPRITRLAESISEGLTGIPARRAPFNEAHFLSVMRELDILQNIVSLFGSLTSTLPQPFPPSSSRHHYIGWTSTCVTAWSTLVQAAYMEVKRRWALVDHFPESESIRKSLELSLGQVTQMAILSAIQSTERLRTYPWISFLTILEWAKPDWSALILLEEQDTIESMGLKRQAGEALIT